MVVLKLLRWIKGYVDFEGTSTFPERFINISTKMNVQMWDVKGGDKCVSGSMNLADYMGIKGIARRSAMRLRVKKRHGLPFAVHKNKKRAGLLIGAVCFVIILKILSMFIWSIEINGAVSLSKTAITEALLENGIGIGTFKSGTDISEVERKTIIKLPDIGWMSINLSGTTAYVEINERVVSPEVVDMTYPCNIKAACDAKIIRLDIVKGIPETVNGDYVTEGQLLVSGVVEDVFGNSYLQHAQAKVYAETQHKISVRIPSKCIVNVPDNSMQSRKRLSVLGIELPISFAAVDGENAFKQSEKQVVTAFGNDMPVWIYTDKWYQYKQSERVISEKEMKLTAAKKIAMMEIFSFNGKKIISKRISESNIDSEGVFDVNYVCEEDIAIEERIGLSESGQ